MFIQVFLMISDLPFSRFEILKSRIYQVDQGCLWHRSSVNTLINPCLFMGRFNNSNILEINSSFRINFSKFNNLSILETNIKLNH